MKKFYRRSISGLLALLICFTTILSSGVTAFAASSSGETAKSYLSLIHISEPTRH